MKKLIFLAASALVLASVTAYAQMNHGNSQARQHQDAMSESMPNQMHGQMHAQMDGQMHNQSSGESGGHSDHGADVPRGDRGPSSMAFHGINRQMHDGMNITFTGNPTLTSSPA